ncbi:MAG: cobalt ECF transporter T component CbiQ [Nitrospirae bacterium]|nr:cobalt ECF transporter T component CbiQ [Nitrospirota bacterium]MCL5237647.1 cobalt ECF transporter T component CbiQ [Nitrospirota bacterium]
MENKIPAFLLEEPPPEIRSRPARRASKSSFIDRGLKHVAGVINTGYIQWETASQGGFLQGLDARVKVIFLAFFILIVSLKRELHAEAAIGVFIFLLAAASHISLPAFYRRVFFFGFFFGFLVALPSSLNSVTRGEIVLPLVTLSKPYDFWIYHIPRQIGITREGLFGVAMLTLRIVNSVSLSFLILYTTPFTEIIKALKILKIPDTVLMMLTLSYKYIFIFAKTVEEMHLAKRSRLAGGASSSEGRRWIAGRITFIFRKTRLRCEEVFKAMLGRGFSDSVRLYGSGRLTATDRLSCTLFIFTGILFLFM